MATAALRKAVLKVPAAQPHLTFAQLVSHVKVPRKRVNHCVDLEIVALSKMVPCAKVESATLRPTRISMDPH